MQINIEAKLDRMEAILDGQWAILCELDTRDKIEKMERQLNGPKTNNNRETKRRRHRATALDY